jgi:hypothetical protein
MKGGSAGTKDRPAGVKSNPSDGKRITTYEKLAPVGVIRNTADERRIPADEKSKPVGVK